MTEVKFVVDKGFLCSFIFPYQLFSSHCSIFSYHHPHELCSSFDGAAHYHILGFQFGGFTSDPALNWSQSKEVEFF
jgi:hypothetical protein